MVGTAGSLSQSSVGSVLFENWCGESVRSQCSRPLAVLIVCLSKKQIRPFIDSQAHTDAMEELIQLYLRK